MRHRHALLCIAVHGLTVLAGYAHPVQRHLCSNRALSTFHALMRFHASCAFGFIHSHRLALNPPLAAASKAATEGAADDIAWPS